jgi:hypothetical protein
MRCPRVLRWSFAPIFAPLLSLFSLSRFFHLFARLSNCKPVWSSNFTMLFWQWCCFGWVSGCGCWCTADHHSNVVALSHSIVVVAFHEHLVFKKPSLNNLPGEKEGPAQSHPVRLSPFPPLPLLPELSTELRCCRLQKEMLHQSYKELLSIRAWNFFCVRGLLLGTFFALVLFFWSFVCSRWCSSAAAAAALVSEDTPQQLLAQDPRKFYAPKYRWFIIYLQHIYSSGLFPLLNIPRLRSSKGPYLHIYVGSKPSCSWIVGVRSLLFSTTDIFMI